MTSCTLYERESHATVMFTASNAEEACDEYQRAASNGFRFWSHQPTESGGEREIVCELYQDSGASVIVSDTGSHFVGDDVCAGFVSTGDWREVP